MKSIYREITPLNTHDCFTVFARNKENFDFPLHTHDEYELNFIANARGAKRIVGYHMGEIDDAELVFVGGNLPHSWYTHQCTSKAIREITVQFHKDLFDEKFLDRNQMGSIKYLLQLSGQGILFPQKVVNEIAPRLETLAYSRGFDSVLQLMAILHSLAVSEGMQVLSPASGTSGKSDLRSNRLEKAFRYMRSNYCKELTLYEVAELVNMPEVSFSRFFKKRTGRTFIESLIDIRLGNASRMLVNTTETIAEIAFRCGFNNLSYFNRAFKSKNGCTPRQFRENYTDSKVFI